MKTAETLQDLEAFASKGCGNPDCKEPDCGGKLYIRSACCDALPMVSFTSGEHHIRIECSRCEKEITCIAVASEAILPGMN